MQPHFFGPALKGLVVCGGRGIGNENTFAPGVNMQSVISVLRDSALYIRPARVSEIVSAALDYAPLFHGPRPLHKVGVDRIAQFSADDRPNLVLSLALRERHASAE